MDVIIGANGVKSRVQKAVTGLDDAPTPTGDAAYRAVISTDLMLQDPDLRQLVETPEMYGWMAPRRHLMAYNIVSAISSSKRYLPLLEVKSLIKCCVAREERVQLGTAPSRRRVRRIVDRGRQRRQDACRFC